MIFDISGERETLSTPFESWCAAVGIHPEHLDAWTLYELNTQVEHPAAS